MTRSVRLRLLFAVAISLASPSGAAFAQGHAPAAKPAPPASAPASASGASPSPPPPPATPSLAETLSGSAKADYDSARLLLGVDDFAGALIKFSAAYGASKDARLLFNMAACESKLHHYARALGLVKGYVKDGGALLTDQDRAQADAAIRAFEPLTSTVTLSAPEAGATVTVDDQVVGQTPLAPFLVDIGVHKVRVSKPDYQDFTTELTVSGSAQFTIDAKLALVVHEGRVSVRAGTGDTIAIDGVPVGTGLFSGALKSGGHTLRVTAPGMTPYQAEVLVQDGQARELSVTLDPEPSRGLLPAWAWIAGGVVVAGGLSVGGYFLFKPSPKYEGPAGNLGPGIVQASAPVHF